MSKLGFYLDAGLGLYNEFGVYDAGLTIGLSYVSHGIQADYLKDLSHYYAGFELNLNVGQITIVSRTPHRTNSWCWLRLCRILTSPLLSWETYPTRSYRD